MPESNPTPIRHLPSQGLNLYEDESLIQPTFCSTCRNCLVDNLAFVTRKGIAATHYETVTAAAHSGTLAHYSDGSEDDTFIIDTTTLKKDGTGWETLPLPAGQTLSTNERGDFVQLMDRTFYCAASIKPIQITKAGNVYLAGTPGASLVTKAAWTSDTLWTIPAGLGSPSVETETNNTMYVFGDGGVTLAAGTNEATFTYTAPVASPINFEAFHSSQASGITDYIGFYLHRHNKIAIENVEMVLSDGDHTATCHVAGTVADTDAETGSFKDFNPTGTFRKVWNNDPTPFRTFHVLLRKDWFIESNASFNWGAVTTVSLKVTPSGDGSAACKVTVNDLHLVASPPTPTTQGRVIATFEGGEGWSTGTGVSQSYLYTTEGVYSLKIESYAGIRTASWTPTNPLDLDTLEDGSTLTRRDRIVLNITSVVTGDGMAPLEITVTLTDGNAVEASTTFYVGARILRASRSIRTRSRLLGFMTYSGFASFDTFDWDDVTDVDISVEADAVGATVYLDNLRIERGIYRKMLASFTPGVIDGLAQGVLGDAIDPFLSKWPLIGATVSLTSDFLQQIRYRSAGYGYFQMPYTEKAERGAASFASMLLCAGPEEVSLSGVAASLLDESIEGFRVTHMFPHALFATGKDFNNYNTINGTAVPIQDHDMFRCWTWIEDHTKLERIKFRIYTERTTISEGFHDILSGGAPGDFRENYYEYVWDASTLVSSQYNQLAAYRHLERTQDTNALNTLMENWSRLSQVSLMKVGSGGTDLTVLGSAIMEKTGVPKSMDLPAAFGTKNNNAYGILGSTIQKTLSEDNFKKAARALGTDFGVTNVRDEDDDWKSGTHKVITWRRGDMLAVDGKEGDEEALNWSKVIGYSIEVVPKPGETAKVAFDNWYISKKGALNGVYSYCYTFVNDLGVEGQPSITSKEINAKNSDVYLSNLPSVWPDGVDQLNIYRCGGTYPDYALIGKLGKAVTGTPPTTFVDNKTDEEVGQLLLDDGMDPPKCKYMVKVGDRIIYANITEDSAGQAHPSRAYISDPLNPGKCQLANIREFSPNDGTEITGGIHLDGVSVIFKDRSIWILNPNDLMPHRHVSALGCIARRSIAVKDGMIFFLSHDGPAVYNLHQASSEIGRPVRKRFDDVADAGDSNANAVGFIYREYYWLFYGDDNEDAVVLHIPTRSWVEAKFKTGTLTHAQVLDIFQRDSASDTYIVTPTQTYNFLSGETDAGQAIDSTITVALSGLGSGEVQKNLKAIYTRIKKLVSSQSPTVTITPATDNGGGTDMTITLSADGDTSYQTRVLSPAIGTNGYTHSLTISISGRVSIAMMTSILDALPLELA